MFLDYFLTFIDSVMPLELLRPVASYDQLIGRDNGEKIKFLVND